MIGGRITLHPEHGLNPSLDLCFWCGEAQGVALLGRNKGEKAPHKIVTTYEPCPACKAKMALGVCFIEVRNADRPTEDNPVEFTGRYFVLSDEGAAKLVSDPDLLKATLEKRKAYLPPEAFAKAAALLP